jgi:hypothetical protein
MERFNLKKINEVKGKEPYHVGVSNRFTALEDLETEVDINRAWEIIRENITISAQETEDQIKGNTKLQWLQDPSEINGDNLKM